MTNITNNTQSGLAGAIFHLWDLLRRLPYRKLLLLLVLTFVGLTWWGYSASPSYSPRASNEWSKGRPVGETPLNETVAAQATSHSTYLVWADPFRQLHYARLNRAAEVAEDTLIAVPTFYPRNPQLRAGAGNTLHLIWLDELEGQASLNYVRLNISGRPQINPVTVSLPDGPVELARLVLNQEGQAEIFWSSASGVIHVTLDEAGEVVRPSTLLVPGGTMPAIQVDRQDRIHMVWLEAEAGLNQSLYYAVFDPERRVLSRPIQMSVVFLRVGQALDGPALALDDEHGYIFWTVIDRRDGTSRTDYVTFPLGDPTAAVQSQLRLRGVDFIQDSFVLDGQRSKAFVALSGQAAGIGRGPQIAVARFRQGQFDGHQVITAGRDASFKPVLLTDVLGELHLVWIDTIGFNRYRVLYASTADQARQALNVITLWDVANTVVSGVMSLTLVIGFAPLMIGWSLLSMIWVVIYYLVTHDEDLQSPQSWGVFATAVALQIGAMMVVPLADSDTFSRFILPALLAAVALVGVYIYIGVKRGQSILVAFFIFALTHGLLRLAVYALSNIG